MAYKTDDGDKKIVTIIRFSLKNWLSPENYHLRLATKNTPGYFVYSLTIF